MLRTVPATPGEPLRGNGVFPFTTTTTIVDTLTKFYSKTKDPRIIVLRTEQLEQDWRSIEVDVLNGPEPFDKSFTFPHKHASAKEERDLYLSEESTRNICRALCEEIQVYKRILIRAENLDENDFVESMKVLAQHCPVQAESSDCG